MTKFGIRILDRYVARHFAVSYACTFLSAMGFYMVLDFVVNMEEFLKHGGLLDSFRMAGTYYLYQAPIIFLQVSPVMTLIAAIFAMVRLVRRNEHIPIIASGVSLQRALAPVFAVSLGITLLVVLAQEVVIPNNAVEIADLTQLHRRNKQWILNYTGMDSHLNLVMIAEYEHEKETARRRRKDDDRPAIWVIFRDASFRETKLLEARRAEFRRDEAGEKRWCFLNYTLWRMDERGLRSGKPETGALWKPNPSEFALDPDSVRDVRDDTLFLSTTEIVRRWREDPTYVRLAVLANCRLAYPLLNLILLMAGLPFVMTGDPKNAFAGVGKALVMGAALFGMVFVSQDLGYKGDLHPFLAAWLPVMLFGAIGILQFDSMRT